MLQTSAEEQNSTNTSVVVVRKRGSFLGSWTARNIAELANEPTLYVPLQGRGVGFLSSANTLPPSLYKRLALRLKFENITGKE